MPGVGAKTHSVVCHPAQIRVPRLFRVGKRIPIDFKDPPDGERVIVLIEVVVMLAPNKVIMIRRASH